MTPDLSVALQILFLYICCASVLVTADFTISTPSIPVDNLVFQGNGSVSTTDIILSLNQQATSSIVYWKYAQDVQHGFKATILYISTDCDVVPYYGGGDGFSFFFASSINTSETLSTGGTLGLANKTNIAMVGFDLLNDKIVYKATTEAILGPRAGYTAVNAIVSGWRCYSPGIYVQIEYAPPTFRITSNTTNLNESITMDLRNYFDPYSQLYVGLSAATGQAFMKQTITSWEFTGVPPPPEVIPILECYEKPANKDTYVAYMGYRNPTTAPLSYEVGPNNGFSPDPQDRGQPTTFQSGRSTSYPLSAFSFGWNGTELTWNLTSNFVRFNAANTAFLCPKSLKIVIVFSTAANLSDTQINAIVQSLANFLGISSTRVTVTSVNYVIISLPIARSIMQSQQGTLELEISGTDSQTENEPSAAESVQKFVNSASNSTLVNEVLNPPGTENTIEVISVNPKSTGVEGTGSLVVAPPVTSPVAQPVATTAPSTVPKAVSLATSMSTVMSLVVAVVVVVLL